MTHMAIRLRMESQNRLAGLPTYSWREYMFPTVDALVRFGIQSARDGWEVKFPDGCVLRREEEAPVGTKTLTKSLTKVGKPLTKAGGKPLPKRETTPNRPKLHNVPPNTVWSGNHLVTTMADGLVLAWDICGLCSSGASSCTCSAGITAPNSIRYIATKTAGVMAGEKWETIGTNVKPSNSDRTPTYVMPWRERASGSKPLPKRLTKDKPVSTPKALPKPLQRPTRQAPKEPTVQITDQTRLSDFDSEAASQAKDLLGALAKRLGSTPKQQTDKPLPSKTLPTTKSLPVKSAGKPLPRKKAL